MKFMRFTPSTSKSRLKPKVVWVGSLVPKEKKSACSAISSASRQGPGKLDHSTNRDLKLEAGFLFHLLNNIQAQLA